MMLLFLIGAALSANSAQGTERPESHNNNAINCTVLKLSSTVGQNLRVSGGSVGGIRFKSLRHHPNGGLGG